jgi:hypothetical protein
VSKRIFRRGTQSEDIQNGLTRGVRTRLRVGAIERLELVKTALSNWNKRESWGRQIHQV